MAQQLELGLDTFGDVTADASGTPLPHAQVLRNLVEQAVLADQVGVDFIGFGEHHRDDFAVSAPEIVAVPPLLIVAIESPAIVGVKFRRTPNSLKTTVTALLLEPPCTIGIGNSPPARKLASWPL
jgi:hypothetical protein